MGGVARALLRNPHVCKALGCWGASLQNREAPRTWDDQGTEAGEASLLSAPSRELVLPARLALGWGGGKMGARGLPLPCLCAVSPVGTSGPLERVSS